MACNGECAPGTTRCTYTNVRANEKRTEKVQRNYFLKVNELPYVCSLPFEGMPCN